MNTNTEYEYPMSVRDMFLIYIYPLLKYAYF